MAMNTIDKVLLNNFPLSLMIPALACIGYHCIIFVFDHVETFQHKLSDNLMPFKTQKRKECIHKSQCDIWYGNDNTYASLPINYSYCLVLAFFCVSLGHDIHYVLFLPTDISLKQEERKNNMINKRSIIWCLAHRGLQKAENGWEGRK